MKKPANAASTLYSRRARTLAAALSVLFVGTAIYAHNVRAAAVPGPAVDQPQMTHPRDSIGNSTLVTPFADVPIAWTSPKGPVGRLQQIPTR